MTRIFIKTQTGKVLALLCILTCTGCDKVIETTADMHARATKAWEDYSTRFKERKKELARNHDPDQDSVVNLDSVKKAVRDELVNASTAARDEAVSVVKEGTKQALEEAKEGTKVAADVAADTAVVAANRAVAMTSNADDKIKSAEKVVREQVVYYMPKNLPKSEKEAQQLLFGSTGGWFEDLGMWLKNLFRRPRSQQIQQSTGRRLQSYKDGKRRVEGRKINR